MICVKCKNKVDLHQDDYTSGIHKIDLMCVDCYTSEEGKENSKNIRNHLKDRLEKEVDDYILLIGEDRIQMMIFSMNVTGGHTDVFRRSVKKLYDIDYEDVIINGPEWIHAKIREKTINNVLDD